VVYYAETGKNNFGFEIQPPLSEVAANGLQRTLERRLPGRNAVTPNIDITRNDEDGTVLDVQINWEGARLGSTEIATILNPAKQIDVAISPPAPTPQA
jgi:hypothetical protein